MLTFSRSPVILLACFACAVFSGCQNLAPSERGVLFGGGLGSLVGGIIGHQSGHAGTGAVIGAALGGTMGGIAGRNEELAAERDAAIAQASFAEQTAEPPLTNFDIIRMTQAGVGSPVIIESITNQRHDFDVSANSIIMLKQSGVSDEVIQAMQRSPRRMTVSAPTPPPVRTVYRDRVYVEPAPPVVVVRPRPYYSHWHHHHHRHHDHGSSVRLTISKRR